MARPIGTHKLSKMVRENVCKFIALGVSQEAAAAQEGISKSTYWSWVRRGRAALEAAQIRARAAAPETGKQLADGEFLKLIDRIELPYAELAASVEEALGKAEAGYTLKVAKAADHDWRAAAWWLEKRRPELYGGRESSRYERDPAQLTNEELVGELNELGFVQATVVEAAPAAELPAGSGQQPSEPANDNAGKHGSANSAA
jgi:hypothetical protein